MSIDSLPFNSLILDEIGGGGAGLTSLQNTDNNVAVSVVGSMGTINLKPDITITGEINCKNIVLDDFKNIWNQAPLTNGDVLSCDTNGNLAWIAQAGGSGITTLSNTDNNVSVSVVGNTGTVNLENNITLTGDVNANDAHLGTFKNIWNTQPATNGEILSCDTNGNLSWVVDAGITTLSNTDNNVSVSVVGNTGTVNLENNITLTGDVNANDVHLGTFKNIWNTQPNNNGDVLSCDTNGNLSWVAQSGGSGITTLNNTDGLITPSVVGNTGTINITPTCGLYKNIAISYNQLTQQVLQQSITLYSSGLTGFTAGRLAVFECGFTLMGASASPAPFNINFQIDTTTQVVTSYITTSQVTQYRTALVYQVSANTAFNVAIYVNSIGNIINFSTDTYDYFWLKVYELV